MEDPSTSVERAYTALRSWVRDEPLLESEFQSSAREFFGAPAAAPGTDRELSERRHLEWFVLERESAALGGMPLQMLAEREEAAARGLGPAEIAAWIGSFAGVFEITSVRPGEGLWLRDLAGSGEYPLAEPEVSQLLASGDMIAGRIYPVGDTLFRASPAAAFFRDAELLVALRSDFDRERERRRGVLRLAQSEIERLFHRPRVEPQTDPLATVRALLLQGGVANDDVDEIFEELASVPYSADSLAPGAGDLLGEILDRLAFETDLELESTRVALIAAWQHLTRKGPGQGPSLQPAPPPARARQAAPKGKDRIAVAEALAKLDLDRAAGRSVDQSFDELERALELEPEVDPDELAPAPDFPGAVAALVEEFLWDLGRLEGEAAANACELLRTLGRYAEPIGIPDNLGLRALADYAARWVIDEDLLHGAEDASVLVHALQRFVAWAEETGALTLEEGSRGLLERLARELPRIAEANQRRTRSAESGEGDLFELLALDSGELRLRRDGEEISLRADPQLALWLRPGDLLRGRDSEGRLALYACYPCLPADAAGAASDAESD
ncbi:MAG: hypothetical protein IPJ19_02060 [Planctomycetes bacterium]|nr:hypothetical protein [Planctomycetota bacterium]